MPSRAGEGIRLSRDFEEAKKHGGVVLKVLAYVGKVVTLDKRGLPRGDSVRDADSFMWCKVILFLYLCT